MCWRGHPALTKEIEGRANLRDDIERLADVTQQLHLDMSSMSAERHERFRKQRDAAAAAHSAVAVPVTTVPPDTPAPVVPTGPSTADAG